MPLGLGREFTWGGGIEWIKAGSFRAYCSTIGIRKSVRVVVTKEGEKGLGVVGREKPENQGPDLIINPGRAYGLGEIRMENDLDRFSTGSRKTFFDGSA